MGCIFLFTGQGAQYYGMGRGLYETVPGFRDLMDRLDQIPREKTSRSVVDELYQKTCGQTFDRVLYTHPALFMVQYALGRTLMDQGLVPDVVMGGSLGEYIAMALAEVVPPEEMLSLLIDHAQAVETLCRPGGMAGVMGPASLFDAISDLSADLSLACISSPSHFVISGDARGMARACRHLEQEKVQCQPLPIRYGFHSANMDPVQATWEDRLDRLPELGPCRIPTVSCLSGEILTQPGSDHLARIPRDPIRFPQACQTLTETARAGRPALALVDLGPGGYTTAFMRQQGRVQKGDRVFRIMTLLGREADNFKKVTEALVP